MLGKNWFVRCFNLIKIKLENSSRKMAVGMAIAWCGPPCTEGASDHRLEEPVEIRVYLHQGRWKFFVSSVLKF